MIILFLFLCTMAVLSYAAQQNNPVQQQTSQQKSVARERLRKLQQEDAKRRTATPLPVTVESTCFVSLARSTGAAPKREVKQ